MRTQYVIVPQEPRSGNQKLFETVVRRSIDCGRAREQDQRNLYSALASDVPVRILKPLSAEP